MKILFTGFTSRTVGSDRNVYDYLSNVDVLRRVLELAGHEVDARPVSLLTDAGVADDYDCALVGVAAANGLSSRFKLGACWALHEFGRRAAIFPSDGRNVGVFVNSCRTCLHIPRFLGEKIKPNNVVDHELGAAYPEVWTEVLETLEGRRRPHPWKMLVPVFAWGDAGRFGTAFGTFATGWDPTNVAVPMQPWLLNLSGAPIRERRWVLATLQDNDGWVAKQGFKWPVVKMGNKRKARQGDGLDYVSEQTLVSQEYTRAWGALAFGYPLAEGGWWRMRYIHAALAGCVTCCDTKDAWVIGGPYKKNRLIVEGLTEEDLAVLAQEQKEYLFSKAWPADRAIEAVDAFVRGLKDAA